MDCLRFTSIQIFNTKWIPLLLESSHLKGGQKSHAFQFGADYFCQVSYYSAALENNLEISSLKMSELAVLRDGFFLMQMVFCLACQCGGWWHINHHCIWDCLPCRSIIPLPAILRPTSRFPLKLRLVYLYGSWVHVDSWDCSHQLQDSSTWSHAS